MPSLTLEYQSTLAAAEAGTVSSGHASPASSTSSSSTHSSPRMGALESAAECARRSISYEPIVANVPPIYGLIGLGGMGRMYLTALRSALPFDHPILVCEAPDKYHALVREFAGTSVVPFPQLKDMAPICDFILISVPTHLTSTIVKQVAPHLKHAATICGQTSVKGPEIAAFEQHVHGTANGGAGRTDVGLVSCHSMHGPGLDPRGQSIVLIRHRATDLQFSNLEFIAGALGSRISCMDYTSHDRTVANTQVLTHTILLSMGTAWRRAHVLPWECERYEGGIENAKANLTARILGNDAKLYADLAFGNDQAFALVHEYSVSVDQISQLLRKGQRAELLDRMVAARANLFRSSLSDTLELLFDEDLDAMLQPFCVSRNEKENVAEVARAAMASAAVPDDDGLLGSDAFRDTKNSQLSLLALADVFQYCARFFSSRLDSLRTVGDQMLKRAVPKAVKRPARRWVPSPSLESTLAK
ncbi:Prephenate dehydrogenase (NADP) [Ceraceosorus bombacis]|uniref:Prephenate dehydrogenase (NADP ) n=1 Tax=Ceraceosorus bombacis TaxID=401625 RepID=A0A0P1BNU1_9BASI|nr:Prephenate dehydrogenase (NADP) [Ceraceosorus bombacis]